jgi:hypothetical protein
MALDFFVKIPKKLSLSLCGRQGTSFLNGTTTHFSQINDSLIRHYCITKQIDIFCLSLISERYTY